MLFFTSQVYKITSTDYIQGEDDLVKTRAREREIRETLRSLASIYFFYFDFSPLLLSSSLLDASTIIRALGKYTGETTSSSARFCPRENSNETARHIALNRN